MKIIGRQTEKERLKELYKSGKPEFIAVYGRRRVGKTYLIREYLHKHIAFQVTGLANSKLTGQLDNFNEALLAHGFRGVPAHDWLSAFRCLRELLASLPPGRKVVFLDELPWLDTHKSGFLPALEHFWNGWAASNEEIMLIVCGSATSWLISNIVNNRGGLHNRLTCRLSLRPFTLRECEEYCQNAGLVFSRRDLAEGYMVFGGIPYYWSLLRKKFSLAQNIDLLFFAENAALEGEYERIYASLFKNYQKHVKIVETLSQKRSGMTREEIIAGSGLNNGGSLSRTLTELVECGFVRKFRDFTKQKNGYYYQLVDFYSHFYHHFCQNNLDGDSHYWANRIESGAQTAWRGYAFEQVCLAHIAEIKTKLGIAGVSAAVSSWHGSSAEIDLLIDRRDGVINICEIKYANKEFAITKEYSAKLRHKVDAFRQATSTRKALHLTMVTTFGLKNNKYSAEIQSEVALDDLF
jgi:predicted transcriptional regulator